MRIAGVVIGSPLSEAGTSDFSRANLGLLIIKAQLNSDLLNLSAFASLSNA
jgi:hypothetical protein